jgi:hypothetical protein
VSTGELFLMLALVIDNIVENWHNGYPKKFAQKHFKLIGTAKKLTEFKR